MRLRYVGSALVDEQNRQVVHFGDGSTVRCDADGTVEVPDVFAGRAPTAEFVESVEALRVAELARDHPVASVLRQKVAGLLVAGDCGEGLLGGDWVPVELVGAVAESKPLKSRSAKSDVEEV